MESLAKAILQAFEKVNDNSYLHYKLPIKTICGIKVCAEFKVSKYLVDRCNIIFVVESHDLCNERESESSSDIFNRVLLKSFQGALAVEHIIACIEQILAILPTLKFDKKTSQLTDEEFFSDDVVELFRFDNTTVDDICSVCHELTNTRTDCSHTLCLVCMSSIKGYYEGGEHVRDCPLCREDISMLHY